MVSISIIIKLEEANCCDLSSSSLMVIVLARDESFNAMMNWLPKDGIARLKACGKTILIIARG